MAKKTTTPPKKSHKADRKQKRENLMPKLQTGRPPKKYSDEECVTLAKDLISWLQDKEGGRLEPVFVEWYGVKHDMFRADWKNLCLRAAFSPYYATARQLMARNIMCNKEIAQSYGNRYLAVYDENLHAHEEHKADLQMLRQIKIKEKEAQVTALGIKEFVKAVKEGTILEELTQKEE